MFRTLLVAALAYHVGRSAPRACPDCTSTTAAPPEVDGELGDPVELPVDWPPGTEDVVVEIRELMRRGARLFWRRAGGAVEVLVVDPETRKEGLVSWTVDPTADAQKQAAPQGGPMEMGAGWPREQRPDVPAYAESYPY